MSRYVIVLWLLAAAVACGASDDGNLRIAQEASQVPAEVVGDEVASAASAVAPSEDASMSVLEGAGIELPAFVEPRAGHRVVWTGKEMVLWGGWTSEAGAPASPSGMAFDPKTDQWREIAEGPLSGRAYSFVAWSGEEMLVVGGQRGREVLVDAAAYDPVSDSWRGLDPLPVRHAPASPPPGDAIWTGDELLVWLRDSDSMYSLSPHGAWRVIPVPAHLNRATTDGALRRIPEGVVAITGEGPGPLMAAFLPAGPEAEWVRLPPADEGTELVAGDPYPINSGIVDGHLVTWSRAGRFGDSFTLDVAELSWSRSGPAPIAACEGHLVPVELDGVLAIWEACHSEEPVVVLASPAGWHRLKAGAGVPIDGTTAVWTGDEILTVSSCCFGGIGRFSTDVHRYRLPTVLEPGS